MLNERGRKGLRVGLVVLLAAIVLFVGSFWIPMRITECAYNDHTKAKECADYHVGPFALLRISRIIEEYNASITALATVAIALFTWTLWRVTDRTVSLTLKEFHASHRPRIRVRNIVVSTINGVDIRTLSEGLHSPNIGHRFVGQFYAANVGDAEAKIVEARIQFWATIGYLPMRRPYEGEDGNIILLRPNEWNAPGVAETLQFDVALEANDPDLRSVPPKRLVEDKNVFVLG